MIATLGRLALRIAIILMVMASSAFFLQVFLPIAIPIVILVVAGMAGLDTNTFWFHRKERSQ
jgi:CHASE2 domain-containing sensor protein